MIIFFLEKKNKNLNNKKERKKRIKKEINIKN